jgi:hypothetical protein
MFNKHPKSYYGIFSIFFKAKLFVLLIIYILLVLLVSYFFSLFYNLIYVGSSDYQCISVEWLEKWYFSIMTFMSPGFTEFLPIDTKSRVISVLNGLVGLSFNALFLSILVARALLPHEPFQIVPFMVYDPRTYKITLRFYSSLPFNCYNLRFRLFRFSIYQNKQGKQLGSTREITITPDYRNTLLKNYGILLNTKVDFEESPQNASTSNTHKRKNIPIEWLIPEHTKCPDGHFYLTIEAESMQGKMFQTCNFYLTKDSIKIGQHKLLNEGEILSLNNWYKWKKYRWDLWEKIAIIPNIKTHEKDLLVKRYLK